MSFPKPETIQAKIDRTRIELRRLKLLKKMAELYEKPEASKETPTPETASTGTEK
jgi:hypothetical protein